MDKIIISLITQPMQGQNTIKICVTFWNAFDPEFATDYFKKNRKVAPKNW
jgi:hypothetical protein